MVQRVVKREMQGTVVEASSGFLALEALETGLFNVVIISLDLHPMTGRHLLELMRSIERTRALPTIMLSTRSDAATIRSLVELGVAGVLAKPLDPALLSRRLWRFASAVAGSALLNVNANDALHASETVLVVDGDVNMCHFVADALRGGRRILQMTSGAAAISSALVHKPGLAIIGQNIGLLDGPALVREIRALPSIASMRLIKLSPDPSETVPPEGFDGVVLRTFLPDVFRRAIAALAGAQGPFTKFLSAYPGLMGDITTGVEQVCGMMLGVEVAPVERTEPLTGASIRSVQIVTIADQKLSLRLEFESALSTAASMTAQLVGGTAADVTDEDACATIAEMANIVTGRLRNALGEAGLVLNCSLPSTRVADDGLSLEAQDETRHLHFASADGTMTLHVVAEAAFDAEDLVSAA